MPLDEGKLSKSELRRWDGAAAVKKDGVYEDHIAEIARWRQIGKGGGGSFYPPKQEVKVVSRLGVGTIF